MAVNFFKRIWLALRGGTAYKQLDEEGQWATWQLPDRAEHHDRDSEGSESEGSESEGSVGQVDKHRD